MNASGRPNTCKSNAIGELALHESGARVRNAYATYPFLGDSPKKFGLIPHKTTIRHRNGVKHLWEKDGHACH